MSYKHIDDTLQWTGAAAIIAGHILNAVGPSMYPYNIAVFAVIGPERVPGVEAFVTKLKSVPVIETLFPFVVAVP